MNVCGKRSSFSFTIWFFSRSARTGRRRSLVTRERVRINTRQTIQQYLDQLIIQEYFGWSFCIETITVSGSVCTLSLVDFNLHLRERGWTRFYFKAVVIFSLIPPPKVHQFIPNNWRGGLVSKSSLSLIRTWAAPSSRKKCEKIYWKID